VHPVQIYPRASSPGGCRCPPPTNTSGLIGTGFVARVFGRELGRRAAPTSDPPAEDSSLAAGSANRIWVRFTIQTGLPRHSAVIPPPGLRVASNTSTAAPAALAFSDG
jgi:hypothetical protein